MKDTNIYLDYQATTPVDKRVLDAMMPYLMEHFGNPSSSSHNFGWTAEAAVKKARKQIADLIGADSSEIIFTSGATESNNLAIRGACNYIKKFSNNTERNHIITMTTEHPCILAVCRHMQFNGFEVTYLNPESNGILDLEKLKAAITDKTAIVSIMSVNNEIGVIQPIKEIGKICKERKVLFHTDCAQAFGKIDLDVNDMNIDMMSISGHKIYGPKGIGALYVRKKPRVRLEPLILGGGQERGMRSGTLPTHLIVGLGEASDIAKNEMHSNYIHIKTLADKFMNRILTEIPSTALNGDPEKRYAGCINISFAGIEGESLVMSLKGIAVSTGSACSSGKLESSQVIKSLGIDEYLAHTNIRFGIGKDTTQENLDDAFDILNKAVMKLRNMSPIWEMLQNNVDLSKIKWKGH